MPKQKTETKTEEKKESKEEKKEEKVEEAKVETKEPEAKEETTESETKEDTQEEKSPKQLLEEAKPEDSKEAAEGEEKKEDKTIEPEESHIFKKVGSIVFAVLSPKMIKDMASAKIVTPELYDKEGYPVDGGLMDIRLGVIDPGLRCKTCGSKLKECIGHFGIFY